MYTINNHEYFRNAEFYSFHVEAKISLFEKLNLIVLCVDLMHIKIILNLHNKFTTLMIFYDEMNKIKIMLFDILLFFYLEAKSK